MATAKLEKVREHFTTCVICTEKYNNPSTLLCHHTFCRSCLTRYIKTQPDSVQNKTIPCPSCRQVTRVPDPTKPVDEWAGQLKPSIIIVGLIDELDQEQGSDGGTEIHQHCTACKKLGETTPSVSWCLECEDSLCERCVKMHRINSGSRDHELVDAVGKVKVKRKVMCQEHNSERVKFHCKDCKKSACHTCCVIHHRACKSVVIIEDMFPLMSEVLNRKSKILSKQVEIKSSRASNLKGEMNRIQKIQQKVQGEVRSATERLITQIRKKEEELLDELKKMTDEDREQLQADLKTEEINIQTLNQYREFIKQALESESEMDLYDVYMACQSGVVEVGNIWNTENTKRRQVTDIKFVQKTEEEQKISLGSFDVTYQDVCVPLSNPVLYETIDTDVDTDKEDTLIFSIKALDVDGVETVVGADVGNSCVKSFYYRNKKACHSTLPTHSTPVGLVQVKEKHVMITLPNSCEIIIVKVTPNLVHISTMTTSNSYVALSFLEPSSLVGSYEEGFDILSMDGHKLKSITAHTDEQLFDTPYFLCSEDNKIIVSDFQLKSLTCWSPEGKLLWRYITDVEPDMGPTGLTSIGKGDLFFAENINPDLVRAKEKSKVLQMSDTGHVVREVLRKEDVHGQIAGMYLDKERKLFVCVENKIKVFVFA